MELLEVTYKKPKAFIRTFRSLALRLDFRLKIMKTVLKVVTEIGVLNRQHTVAIRRGDDVKFIQSWRAHTVAGQVVTA
jgi:hypothetical protein